MKLAFSEQRKPIAAGRVLRPAAAAKRDAADHPGDVVLAQRADLTARSEARFDHVDADAVAGELQCEAFRQPLQRSLGRAIGNRAGVQFARGAGRDVDDRALAALGDHQFRKFAGQHERRAQIDAPEPIPIGELHLDQHAEALVDAGAVDHDVRCRPFPPHGFDQVEERALIGQLGRVAEGARGVQLQLGDRRLQSLGTDVGQTEQRTLAGEPLRDPAAEYAGGAGQHDLPVGEFHGSLIGFASAGRSGRVTSRPRD